MRDQITWAARVRCDHRDAGGQRFLDCLAERLVLAGVNEGLLPPPVKTAHNMGWYSEQHVETLKLIQRLQRERFLPLKAIKSLLHDRGMVTAVGDEGGFAPNLSSNEEAIAAILEASEAAGHRDRVAIAPKR